MPESSTPICQGASQAFKCRGCPCSACAGTAASIPAVRAASPDGALGHILPAGSAMRGRAWTRRQGQMGTGQEG